MWKFLVGDTRVLWVPTVRVMHLSLINTIVLKIMVANKAVCKVQGEGAIMILTAALVSQAAPWSNGCIYTPDSRRHRSLVQISVELNLFGFLSHPPPATHSVPISRWFFVVVQLLQRQHRQKCATFFPLCQRPHQGKQLCRGGAGQVGNFASHRYICNHTYHPPRPPTSPNECFLTITDSFRQIVYCG